MDKSFKKPIKSSTVKCGKRTYFFDVQVASNNNKYLKITESQFLGEGTERKRNSFILFPDDIQNFEGIFKEMAGYLA